MDRRIPLIATILIVVGCGEEAIHSPTELDGTWVGEDVNSITITNGKLTHIGDHFVCEEGFLVYLHNNTYGHGYNYDEFQPGINNVDCIDPNLTFILSSSQNHLVVIGDNRNPAHFFGISSESSSVANLLEKETATPTESYTSEDLAQTWIGKAVYKGSMDAAVYGTGGISNAVTYTEDRSINCDGTSCDTTIYGLSRTNYSIDDDITEATVYNGDVSFSTNSDTADGSWSGGLTNADSKFGLLSNSRINITMSNDKTFALFEVCHVTQDSADKNIPCSTGATDYTNCDKIYNTDEPLNFGCDIVAGERQ
jgi:hypothetical protein